MIKNLFLPILLFTSCVSWGQSNFENVPIENIGPTVQSGRVSDIDINPDDPTIFYVAYASGGLWYTENNGTSFTPLFDHEEVMTIGDIAVDWTNNVIWVGTGEVNSSRSSYAGKGIYKSSDQGKSWENVGLPESHHIGRIVLQNESTAVVAVLGHLYTPNQERGIYKTTDGGKTWKQTLYVNDNAGAVDLVSDPSDATILYAAIWERTRRAWNFTESGSGSGIYRSTDGGNNWTLLNDGSNAFPTGEGTGRIGLDAVKTKTGIRLYAFLDNYNRRAKSKGKIDQTKLTKDDFKTMSKAEFDRLKNEQLDNYLKDNRFPEKYTSKSVKKLVKSDKVIPSDIAHYTESANSLLFDTPVIGAELYMSDDNGETWKKTHTDYIDNLYNSYGYYFGQVRAYPQDPDKVVIMGVPILLSEDSGATWKNINGANVHVDHHALWINPNRDGHMINGNDGGINITYDHGETWIKCNSPSVGQFYYINVDHEKPYNIYGGLQDNGVWKGSNSYRSGVRWHSTGQYPYKSIMGGDGMQVQIDNRNSNIVYTGYQFGNYFRMDLGSDDRKYITPKQELGDRPYRWNWQSPILISPHNQDIIYLGNNKLMRSMNRGDSFEEISEDLTNGGKKGDVPFGTLSSIDESKLKFGLIYTGSDDGKVWRTDDGGNSWTDLSAGLPQGMWVSRIQASQHDKSTVYLSLNAYRNDDFNSYMYSSTDKGETWQRLDPSLDKGPVNVIKEDPNNPGILYVGTDHGCFISLNDGKQFDRFSNEMPYVPVHDLVIHSSNKDLLIGTHGRSIYKSDISFLDNIDETLGKEIYVYTLAPIKHSNNWGKVYNSYTPAVERNATMTVFSKTGGSAKLKVNNAKGKTVYENQITLERGISTLEYDLSVNDNKKSTLKLNSDDKADNGKYYLTPGNYKVEITKGGKKSSSSLEIKGK